MVGSIVLTVLAWHAGLGLLVPAQATAAQQPAPVVLAKPEQPWPPAGVIRLGKDGPPLGVRYPIPVSQPKPLYTVDARRAKIQGAVWLEAIVDANGKVGEVRVARSLDREFGLDDEAVRTLKTWQFKPATRDGTAIPALVDVEITFTLR
jgi:TonB family protein